MSVCMGLVCICMNRYVCLCTSVHVYGAYMCERKCTHVCRTCVTAHTQASACRHRYMSVCW